MNVRDVATANYRAGLARGVSGAFNIASGTAITINALATMMYRMLETEPQIMHAPPRSGDVRHSLADTSAARDAFGYEASIAPEEGLAEYLRWAKAQMVTR